MRALEATQTLVVKAEHHTVGRLHWVASLKEQATAYIVERALDALCHRRLVAAGGDVRLRSRIPGDPVRPPDADMPRLAGRLHLGTSRCLRLPCRQAR